MDVVQAGQIGQVGNRGSAKRSDERMRLDRVVLREVNWGQLGWITLLAATLLVTLTAAGSNVLSGDVTVSRAVQESGFPGAAMIARFVTLAGGTSVMFALGILLILGLLRSGHYAAVWPVVAALGLRCGNAVIKAVSNSPRPTAGYVDTIEDPSGLGFPSAHVMGVVLLYGVLFVLAGELIRARAPRLGAQAVAIVMIAIVGPGRIYTGAHWPTDVLGAYLYGLLFLIPVVVSYRGLRDILTTTAPQPATLRRLTMLPVTRRP